MTAMPDALPQAQHRRIASGLPLDDARTNGRTDGLTCMAEVDGYLNVSTRDEAKSDSTDDVRRIQNDLAAILPTGERWEVVRSGQREPIRWAKRLAIYLRDEFTCQLCGRSVDKRADVGKELDHVIPWSAGGTDASENLRTTCPSCNQSRSNYRDGTEDIRYRPVTYWCVNCWADGETVDEHYQEGRFCRMRFGHCSYNDTDWNGEPNPFAQMRRIDTSSARVTAFCAHCCHTALTEVTL